MHKVLITGAAGFIGGQLMKLFSEAHSYSEDKPYYVYGIDRTYGEAYGNIIETVDISNYEDLRSYISSIKPDIVIHCAGSADVGKSVKYPEMDYEGNVTLTHNLFFALDKAGLLNTRVVFLSSAAVYGNPASKPIKENANLSPVSPYGLHKKMCEDICQYFRNNYGFDTRIIRIFSAYGEGLKKQIFWDMYQKFKRTGKLDMFGTGDETRDYINIYDLIRAIYLIATSEKNIPVINVANGEEITIRKATETFADCAGIGRELINFSGHEKEGNPLFWQADISLLKSLGYEKKITLNEGIIKYLSWIRQSNL